GRPGVPLGARGVSRMGLAPRGHQLAAGREGGPQRADASMGLGRGWGPLCPTGTVTGGAPGLLLPRVEPGRSPPPGGVFGRLTEPECRNVAFDEPRPVIPRLIQTPEPVAAPPSAPRPSIRSTGGSLMTRFRGRGRHGHTRLRSGGPSLRAVPV